MLTRLAEELPRRAISTELAAGILFSKSFFIRRVEAILSDRRDQIRKFSRITVTATVLCAMISIAVALAVPLGEKSKPSAPSPAGSPSAESGEATPPGIHWLSDEAKEIRAEIAKSGQSEEWKEPLVWVETHIYRVHAGEDYSGLGIPWNERILSRKELIDLLNKLEKERDVVCFATPQLTEPAGKRDVIILTTDGTYISGYRKTEGPSGTVWLPTSSQYERSGLLMEFCAATDGKDVVFKHFQVKAVDATLAESTVTLTATDGKPVEKPVSVPVVTTYSVKLDKPENTRFKPGESIFVPMPVTVKTTGTNLRTISGVADRVTDKQSADTPKEQLAFAIVTPTLIKGVGPAASAEKPKEPAYGDFQLEQTPDTKPADAKEEITVKTAKSFEFDFTGDAFVKDSFSLTMLAVARHYGKQADYATIYALSTNAFAPDICPVESCRATWCMLGQGTCIDLVAKRFGLTARLVQLPEERPTPAPDERGRTWGTPAYNRWLTERMRDCSAAIRRDLVPAAVVVTDGGWQREWHQWGIVTEAHPDGRIVGMTPDIVSPNSMDHDEHYWVITPGADVMTPEAADVEMLRRAIHRIRGDKEPFLATRKRVFGLQAMDLWTAQMEKPAFQEDDPTSSAANARLNALHSYEGATVVASYLRGRIAAFPEPARLHLQRVVQCYERIAGLLEPYSVWEQGKGYRADEGMPTPLIGTPNRQKEHADTVLRPVRDALVVAADEMEKALAATGGNAFARMH
jgi:hypothetical protein